jgi:sodium/hydrogen exchanger 8
MSELLAGGHLPGLRWAHGFYAGVDGMGEFVAELARTDVPLSNGRGAFSTSLAEYAMAAALHFNKQVPRCMDNRKHRVWDKFVMSELRGKTIGLLGWGHIAQATAKLAKAFEMRVHSLRRNAGKAENSGLVDLVFGPYAGGPTCLAQG